MPINEYGFPVALSVYIGSTDITEPDIGNCILKHKSLVYRLTFMVLLIQLRRDAGVIFGVSIPCGV